MANVLDTDKSEFITFMVGVVKIYTDYMVKSFPNQIEGFSTKQGSRYIRIFRGNSVHAFVDMTNGDVLKPASWKAPARHPRGNIFDENNGLGSMGEYGPAYLK